MVLDELDLRKVYIVGGLVDRNRWKRVNFEESTRVRNIFENRAKRGRRNLIKILVRKTAKIDFGVFLYDVLKGGKPDNPIQYA